ncbi:hypothetical protein F4818DRAFT_424554 [Hypoxylon cercidicola]|nr:hypothetical protein F4818DRAFT_424554 [Hypoxylon cercidicola]
MTGYYATPASVIFISISFPVLGATCVALRFYIETLDCLRDVFANCFPRDVSEGSWIQPPVFVNSWRIIG